MQDALDVHRLAQVDARQIVLPVIILAMEVARKLALVVGKDAPAGVTVVQVVVDAHLRVMVVAVVITLVIPAVLVDARQDAQAVLVVALHVLLGVMDALVLMGQQGPLVAQLALAQDVQVQGGHRVHLVELLVAVKVVVVALEDVLPTAQKAVARVAVQFALQVARPLATMVALTPVRQHAQQHVPIPVPINAMVQVREQYKFMNGG